jgi:O-antigen biosynthesis protein WbqV
VENSEFNLYTIDMELAARHGALSRTAILADVRDRERMEKLIGTEAPALVFHAAALKHVPMVEANPEEGVVTNVGGTRNVADACRKARVSTMVLISTDKAVNPTNVMGATKRIAESYCQALDLLAEKNGGAEQTRFITVRFGNVLGSTGSVVPLFQKQLAAGGPLTVTHPEMKRYFMTVREAVELVLQASAMGSNDPHGIGKIFVLDMGEPVLILGLAEQMIRLAGLRPGEDVQIEFTGLRPGEKLYEELFHGSEAGQPSGHEGILIASPRTADHSVLSRALDELVRMAEAGYGTETLATIKRLVPEYAGQTSAGQADTALSAG